MAWSATLRLIVRRAMLRQSGKGNAQQLKESHQQLLDRLYAAPLTTFEYTSTALSVSNTFVVPQGEIWLLYAVDMVCVDGAAKHYLNVAVGENYPRYIAEGTPVPVYVHTGWQDTYFIEQVIVGASNLGPYGRNLYPMILRENEFLYITGGAEQA